MTSTDSLQPPLDESSLLQELVAQFLAHDGYVETERAFAEEVATETAALQSGHDEPLKKYEVEEDHEAINRNRKWILGMDKMIERLTNSCRNSRCDPRWRYRQGPQTHESLLLRCSRRPSTYPV